LPTPVPAPVTIAILEWDMSISPEKNVIGDFLISWGLWQWFFLLKS